MIDSENPTPSNPPPYPSQPAVPPNYVPPIRQNSGGMNPIAWILVFSAAFFFLFIVVSGAIFLKTQGIGATATVTPANGLFSKGSVGIIELNGVILDSKKILKKLDDFSESTQVKAVVLRLNSPGGAVAPSQEIYQAVKAFKKPLVVSMGSVAASGAYYIAMGAKKVYANPGTITGSIGVIMEFMNLEKLYEWAKVQRYAIKTGKFKDIGAEYREMSPEERALMQGMVDDVLSQFKRAVSDGRKLTMDEVTEIADGRVFSGSQAKSAKLVDELGTFQDAINDAGRQAGLKDKPDTVYPEKARPRWMDFIVDDGNKEEDSIAHTGGLAGELSRFLSGHVEQAVTGLEPGIYWIWSGAR
jgi:protease IV